MELIIYNLNTHPEFLSEMNKTEEQGWPEFMRHDKIAQKYWHNFITTFPDFQLILCNEKKEIIGTGNSIPIYWNGTLSQRGQSKGSSLDYRQVVDNFFILKFNQK